MKNLIQSILGIGMLAMLGLSVPNSAFSQCGPHNTIMNQNNGQDGHMFNITALVDVTIDSVWSNFVTGSQGTVEIYYRPGTIVGFDQTPGAWTLVGSAAGIVSAGTNVFTQIPIHINVFIPQGQTYGFYVTGTGSGPSMRYTNGTGTAGNLYNQNGDIQVSQGYGKDYPFNATFNPRIFNGRIFYTCCPTPPTPQGPITGPQSLCQGDTVSYVIPWDSAAISYTWSAGAYDSVLVQGDSTVQIVISDSSTGGMICVALNDTCTTSDTICIPYTINIPNPPSPISGPDTVCTTDSAWFSVPNTPGGVYTWTIPNDAQIISSPDSHAVHIKFGTSSDSICVSVNDGCAQSGFACKFVTISLNPPLALAGLDQSTCGGTAVTMQGNNAQGATGTWSVVSGPSGGNVANPNDPATNFSSSVPGIYQLEWELKAAGCPATYDTAQVTVGITPTADFDFNDVCEGAPVVFTNTSLTNGVQNVGTRWDIDNNGVDNYLSYDAIHQYNSPGTYSVRLIVNALGCSDTSIQTVWVNPMPTMQMQHSDECFGTPVTFQNTNFISLGSIATTTYNYDDGTAPDVGGGSYAPSYIFQQAGEYDVEVTATSNAGCEATTTLEVTVHHTPEPDFSFQNACQFQTTSFTDKSSVQEADLDIWEWDFGDGGAVSNKKNPTRDYTTNGVVPVTLTVWSEYGCDADTTIGVEVFPTPVPEFNYTNKVCLGDTLFMDDVSSISYGSITDWEWTVEDSIEYLGPNAWHYFPEIGWYKVRLKVTSEEGCRNTIIKNVPVFDVPEADFVFESQCEGDLIEFKDSTKFTGSVQAWSWSFNDSLNGTSNERNPEYAFNTYGDYPVTLRVRSPKDCWSEITKTVPVYEKVIPNFGAFPDSGCSPLNVQFFDSTVNNTGVGTTYRWFFGDGTSRKDTADHTYYYVGGKPRSYPVKLRITTDEGCVVETTKDSMVFLGPQPLADFTTSPESGITTKDPLVQFITLAEQTNYWQWYFGDGSASNQQNPSHQFDDEGTYPVTLIATNIFNCSDTIVKDIIVNPENILFVPKAFTPNGDGMNETFEIKGLDRVSEYSIEIFNRWGERVYSSTGVGSSWDGRDGRNRLVQQGVYLYKIHYIDIDQNEVDVTGEILVLGVE